MAANSKNHHIIDASAMLAILLPDEKSKPNALKLTETISQPKQKLLSCSLLDYEILNGLKSAVLKKRFSSTIAHKLLNDYKKLPIKILPIDHKHTLKLSLKHNLSFYDACYLYLSKSTRAPLLTLDKNLKKLTN